MTSKPALKGFLLGVGVTLLIVGAVVFVRIYTSNMSIACAEERPTSCNEAPTVVVSTQDIDPGTKLDPLIDAGAFRLQVMPMDAVVEGAVTSVDQLRGQTTSAYIYANEQIVLNRIRGHTAKF